MTYIAKLERAARDLFTGARSTRNIKHYFQQGTSTADQLADYRQRAIRQINDSLSRENLDLDSIILD
jgi:hypothetical protein